MYPVFSLDALYSLFLWRSRMRIQRVTGVYGEHVSVLVCCLIMELFLFDYSVLFERRENLSGVYILSFSTLAVPSFSFLKWTARNKSVTTDGDKYVLLMQQWQKQGNIDVVVLNLDAFIWGFCRSTQPGLKCRYQAKLVPQSPQETKRCCMHNTEEMIQAVATKTFLWANLDNKLGVCCGDKCADIFDLFLGCLKVWSTQI